METINFKVNFVKLHCTGCHSVDEEVLHIFHEIMSTRLALNHIVHFSSNHVDYLT